MSIFKKAVAVTTVLIAPLSDWKDMWWCLDLRLHDVDGTAGCSVLVFGGDAVGTEATGDLNRFAGTHHASRVIKGGEGPIDDINTTMA